MNGTTEKRLGPDGPVVALAYRPTLTQRLQLGLFVTVVVSAENAVVADGRGGLWYGPLVFAAAFIVGSLLPRPAGTVITRSTVAVRGFRRRRIAWSQVASITRRRRLGVTSIVLHEVGGRRTRLQGIGAGPFVRDPAFDAKYETVTHWWTAGRASHEQVYVTLAS